MDQGLSRSIAHSKLASLHGFLFKKKKNFMDWRSIMEGTKPILLPHTDTSMSAANACLAGLLSSTTEKAST